MGHHARLCKKLNGNEMVPVSNNFIQQQITLNIKDNIFFSAYDNINAFKASQTATLVKNYAKTLNSQALYTREQTTDQSSGRQLVVLDNIFDNKAEVITILNNLVRDLKRDGWAVIIVASKDDNAAQLNKLFVDTKISVNKVMAKNGILKLKINVASPFKGEESQNTRFPQNKFACKINFNSNPVSFVREHECVSKWPEIMRNPEQLNNKIKNLHDQGDTGKKIAKKLGITLSLVKKRKRILGISQKRVKDDSHL
jgi:hypothetical protein